MAPAGSTPSLPPSSSLPAPAAGPGPFAARSPEPGRQGLLATLWRSIWRYRWRTVAALVLLVLAKVASVCVPLVFKAVIDRFTVLEGQYVVDESGALVQGAQLAVLPVFLLLGYAALRFASTVFTELRDLCFARVTLRTVADFAERALAHLHRMSPRFHAQRNTGAMIRDVDRGTQGIGFLLGATLFTLLPTLVEIGVILVIMERGYSNWFTGIILLSFVVYASYTAIMVRRRMKFQRAVNDLDSAANGRFVDSLLNAEAVRVNAHEHVELQRYATLRDDWVQRSVENQKALSALHLGQGAIIAVAVGAIMLLAGQETMRGTMTVGDLVLVNAYVLQICLPLNSLGFLFREAKDAVINAEKLWSLLGEPAEILDAPAARPLQVTRGEVSFEHVDFGYEPGRQILWDVSLTVGAGQTVAVVGGSGSGKSTLARLLLRLYDVGSGRVAIDGMDVRDATLASLRVAVGIVPQDTALFNDTIGYNIAYGREGASMADVVDAARAAQLDELIASLPQQYDTVVGERGLKLSGGEKQRIAIARAFLRNPPIMIFDEATSALDTRAERAIQAQLDQMAQGRTTLIIAHRLSTIVNADQIIVLDHGRIVERGRHDELLQAGGLYAQLWDLQRQKQQFDRLERRLARVAIDFSVVLANLVDGLRVVGDEAGVQIYTAVELENPVVVGDPGALSESLWDLGSHAIEATGRGGRIEMRLDRNERYARLSITDGRHARDPAEPAAMASGVRDAAMDPLAVRSAIERQGGRFTLEVPTREHGMRFIVEIPFGAVTAEPRPGEAPAGADAGAGERRLDGVAVMVVDDFADARESLVAVLGLAGAATIDFGSGRETLSWLRDHPPDDWPSVLVCDISLGDEDGYEVMRQVRQLEHERAVPLERRMSAVALTGLARPEDRIRAFMAGFQSHLGKPADPRELVATVAGLAGRGGSGPPALPATPTARLTGPT